MKKEVYPISVLMKIMGVMIKDLPLTKPTYYSVIYNKRPHYESTYEKLAVFFQIPVSEIKESLKKEKNLLSSKKRIKTKENNLKLK